MSRSPSTRIQESPPPQGCCAPAWGLFGALAVALLIRVYLCWTAVTIAPDGGLFIHYARDLRVDPIPALRDYSHRQAPLYSVLVAVAITPARWVASGPDAWILAGRFVATTCGLLAIVGVFALTRRLYDARAAIIAALLMAILPDAAQLCANVLSDMTHLALYLFALLALIVAIERGTAPQWAFLTGILSGLAFLARPEGAAVATIGVGLILFLSRAAPRARVVAILALVGGFVLAAGPYQLLTGKLVAKKDLFEMLRLTLGFGGGWGESGAAVAAELAPPIEVLRQWFRAGRVMIPLLAIAALKLCPPRFPARWVLYTAFAAHMALLNLLDIRHGYVDRRHALLLAVLCLPPASALLDAIAARVAGRRGAGWRNGMIAASLGVCLLAFAPWLLRPVQAGDDHVPAMGRWLAAHAPADAKVVATSRLRRVAVYADRGYAEWAWWDWQTRHLGRSLRELGASCVVLLDVDEMTRGDRNPAFFDELERTPALSLSAEVGAATEPGWSFAGGRLTLLQEVVGPDGGRRRPRLRAYWWAPAP